MTKEDALKIWLPIIADGVKYMPECKEALDMAIEALEQEPKTGHWIDVPVGQYVLLHRCSNCLKTSVTESKYCPNCGAKMEDQNG